MNDHVRNVFASGLITAAEQLEAKDAELAKLRAELAAAKAERDALRALLQRAHDWISLECHPMPDVLLAAIGAALAKGE